MSSVANAICFVPTVWRSVFGVRRSSGIFFGSSYSNNSIWNPSFSMNTIFAFSGGTYPSFFYYLKTKILFVPRKETLPYCKHWFLHAILFFTFVVISSTSYFFLMIQYPPQNLSECKVRSNPRNQDLVVLDPNHIILVYYISTGLTSINAIMLWQLTFRRQPVQIHLPEHLLL